MGRDKALLPVHGRPMVEIAVEKLRTFCVQVSIAGNRDDLRAVAPVVPERRQDAGPIAGIEAGLRAAAFPWALFVPVDVPLVPGSLLANWGSAVLARADEGLKLSFLRVQGYRQPAFCLLHRSGGAVVTAAIDQGTLKLGAVFDELASHFGAGSMWVADAETLRPAQQYESPPILESCFLNVNTPEDLAAVERAPAQRESGQ